MANADRVMFNATGKLGLAMDWADVVLELTPAQCKSLAPLFDRLAAVNARDGEGIAIVMAQVWDAQIDGSPAGIFTCIRLVEGAHASAIADATALVPPTAGMKTADGDRMEVSP